MKLTATIHKNLTLGWLLASTIAISCRPASSQDLEPLHLLFVDERGTPVPSVSVDVSSLVFKGKSSTSFAANNLKSIEGGPLVSDDSGALKVQVPNMGFGNLMRFRLGAEHDSFARFEDWVQVNIGDITQIKLTRGVRIAISAVDAFTKESLQTGLFAIAEQKDLPRLVDWKSNGKGLLLSRRLRVSDKRVRLVQIFDGQAVRFSDPIDVKKSDGEQTFVTDVPMYPALTLAGQIDAKVPRPVKAGFVAVCIAWPTDVERNEYGPAGHWLAHAEIDEDGSFSISGLPKGGWAQVIASCDGWYSVPSAADLRLEIFPGENRIRGIEDSILPALYKFEAPREDTVVPMQPTLTATVRCVDEVGVPISDAAIIASRSQRFFHSSWDSRSFRGRFSTLRELQSLRGGEAYDARTTLQPSVLKGVTNAEGQVTIENLPGKKVVVRADGYRFPDNRVWKEISVDDYPPATITVRRPEP